MKIMSWVKVFRIIPEFRIFDLARHRFCESCKSGEIFGWGGGGWGGGGRGRGLGDDEDGRRRHCLRMSYSPVCVKCHLSEPIISLICQL